MKRHTAGLWLLLAAAFIMFAVSSAFEMPEVAGHKIQSSEIASTLFKPIPSPQPPVRDTLPHIAPKQALPCDTASQVILLFGDSMLEGLGQRLAAYADENGHSLYTVIWYSSTSKHWGTSDRLRSYISKLKPTFIFICLGANELSVADISVKRDAHVKNIISDIGDIPYIWIGPPNWKKDTGINELIRSNTAEGSFFLSDGMDFERASDGAHPTYPSAHQWMDSVVRWIPSHANHPIRLATPNATTAKAKRTFIHKPSDT